MPLQAAVTIPITKNHQIHTILFENIKSDTNRIGLDLLNTRISHKFIDHLIIHIGTFRSLVEFIPMNEYTRHLLQIHSLPISNIGSINEVQFKSLDLIFQEVPCIEFKSGSLFPKSIRFGTEMDFLKRKVIFDGCKEVIAFAQDVPVDEFEDAEFINQISIEVVPQAYKKLQAQLFSLHGIDTKLRLLDSSPVRTQNKNYILDLEYYPVLSDSSKLRELNDNLIKMVGVVETNLFIDLIDRSYFLTDSHLYKTDLRRPSIKM